MSEIPCLQISKGVKQSLSTDGSSAMLLFETEVTLDRPNASVSAITIPASQLQPIRAMLTDLIDKLASQGNGPGEMSYKLPKAFSVGHSDEGRLRGHVALTFDPGLPDQATFLMRDVDALKFAEAIRNDIFSRMSAKERAKMATAIVQPKKLILPGQMQ